MRSRILPFSLALVLGVLSGWAQAQSPPQAPAPRPAEDGDTISLIPTSIKETLVTLSHEGRSIEVPVQFSIRENTSQGRSTLFVLPVWVVERVERLVDGKRVQLSPNDPLIPQDEKRPVQLNVVVRNLLDRPATEEKIVEQLKSLVNKQLGLEGQALRYEKPHMDMLAVRFTLVGQGRGEEPAIALSNAVVSADGLLGFDLDTSAVRRCEQLHGYTSGLALGNSSIVASGPIQVRFERLEAEAQLRYIRGATADLRKRIGSAVNPSGPPPDVIVPFNPGGLAEAHNWIMSKMEQSLRIILSLRLGATEPPLLPLLDRIASNCIRQVEIDQANDNQRLTFLMENQVAITATLAEFKRLSQLDAKARTEALEQAKAHFRAYSRGETRKFEGELRMGLGPIKGEVAGLYHKQDQQSEAEMDQTLETQFRQAFDQLMKSFEGNLKLPTGLQIDERVFSGQFKEFQADLTRRTFFVDYTLHRFAPIRLTGTTDLGTDANAWMRSYAQLRTEHQESLDRLQRAVAEHDLARNALETTREQLRTVQKNNAELQAAVEALLKAAGEPKEWAAAKEQMDRLARIVGELEQRVAIVRKLFDDTSAAKLAKLEQEVDSLRQRWRHLFLQVVTGTEKWAEHTSALLCVAVSPDGLLVAGGSLDNKIQLWSKVSGKSIRTFNGHDGQVRTVAFSPDGKFLASGSDDRTVRLWRVETGELIQTLSGHSDYVRTVAFSPDGKFLASGSDDNTIRLWTVASGELYRQLLGHDSWVRTVVFSPDGQYLASCSDDKTIRLWRVATGELVRKLVGHANNVVSVAFSPDSKLLASGSVDETIRLWSINNGDVVRTLTGHSGHIRSVVFSPDGKFLASGSDDKTVRLWSVGSGEPARTLTGHNGYVRSVAFSPDGKFLASGSNDKTIRLWSVATGDLVQTFSGHTDEVWSVAFSPDGMFLVSGSLDKSVRVWVVP